VVRNAEKNTLSFHAEHSQAYRNFWLQRWYELPKIYDRC